MYTGIVADVGEVVKAEPADEGRVVWVRSELLSDCAIGASVNVSGVCLTVTELDGDVARFDVSAETLQRTTLGTRDAGERVNIERPLRIGDELGGHMVQGHVDGVGRVLSVEREGDGRRIRVAAPPDVLRYTVEKGSVTVDGVSLTVTAVSDDAFEVALVPHTLAVTTLGDAEEEYQVNLEVDVLAKYVERLTGTR